MRVLFSYLSLKKDRGGEFKTDEGRGGEKQIIFFSLSKKEIGQPINNQPTALRTCPNEMAHYKH